jgi:6-phosphofructokinase 1
MKRKNRVGVLTGGGDCAGLNAVIRAVVRSAHSLGWETVGIQESFGGLLNTKRSRVLRPVDVRGILHTGGTILGTTNHGDPFHFPVRAGDGVEHIDRSAEVIANFKKLRLNGLIVIGGDGTLRIGLRFHELGVPVVGVPKTIDNDVAATLVTFGFDSAVSVATDALDRLHTTASSHRRVMVLETMGRNVGWIALHAGIAGGADVILIPEIPFAIDKVCDKIRDRARRGRRFSIVVAAEGAAPIGGVQKFHQRAGIGFEGRLGGIGEVVAERIGNITGAETRSLVLGHLQRGGRPTNWDRILGTRFGSAAMRAAVEGQWGQMVALRPPTIKLVPLSKAVAHLKRVPKSSDIVRAARDLGIAFGD